jgi:SAM-dependent methyltransferase
VDLLPFSAHNIRLREVDSIPGHALLADWPMAGALTRTLDVWFPDRGEQRYTLVDLGCLEGGWTAVFARAGFTCLGIEGRQANFERCELVERELGLGPDLRFVRDDVRELERYGPFDVTFCAGILYHLEQPVSFLEAVAHCTKRLLILDTHYAVDSLPVSYPGQPDLAPDLSEMTTHEGVRGRWYREHLEGDTRDQIEARLWASLDNRQSFWIDRRDLITTLVGLGFSPVYEQLDSHPEDPDWAAKYHRSVFVAVRASDEGIV